MSAEYTITAVGDEPRVWSGDHGDFHIWPVEFESSEAKGKGERKVKASSPKPSVGETFLGEVKQRSGFPAELKRLPAANGFGGGGGGRQRDPVETKRIQHQHAQKIALMFIQAKITAGALQSTSENPKAVSIEEVCLLARKFREDVEGVS